MVALTIKLIPLDILSRTRKQAEGMWKDGKPEKWYYAIPIVLFWLVIIALLIGIII